MPIQFTFHNTKSNLLFQNSLTILYQTKFKLNIQIFKLLISPQRIFVKCVLRVLEVVQFIILHIKLKL